MLPQPATGCPPPTANGRFVHPNFLQAGDYFNTTNTTTTGPPIPVYMHRRQLCVLSQRKRCPTSLSSLFRLLRCVFLHSNNSHYIHLYFSPFSACRLVQHYLCLCLRAQAFGWFVFSLPVLHTYFSNYPAHLAPLFTFIATNVR
ncbi:hypothetical protein CSKR_203550 [Clonorchis sinensis]|uniref:Uncharacterized protein n=1 Tax=Clonorchis sinensis TaxID=79923 RepID=A0A8T1MC18_CLOSI|nr:hypothetical protein CSKR_203550 [Clonorchis sinensis]